MRYGDALPSGFNIPTSAFWLKKDLTPKGNPFNLLRLQPGDRVMDCGLFIGTFTAACMEQGAGSVKCYEASPQNAKIAHENLSRYGDAVQIVEAALVSTDVTNTVLTMSGFSGANSILESSGRSKHITVSAVNFRRELLAFNPTVVKLDVEGAEYDLLDSLTSGDLAGVRALFIEFHPIEERDGRIAQVKDFVQDEGLIIESQRLRAFVASRDAVTLFTDEAE